MRRVTITFLLWLICATLCVAQTPQELATVKICGYHGNGQWGYLTGVVFARDDATHYALTNNHLFRDPVQRLCVWPIGQTFAEADLVDRSESHDVAVLRFQPETPIDPVPLATTDLSPGDPVTTIGYPRNASRQNHRTGTLFGRLGKWQELSFPIQQGESGSPVFSRGRVAGLCWGTSDRGVIVPASLVGQVIDRAATKDVQLTQWRSNCVGGTCSPVQVIQSRPLSRQVVAATPPPAKPCNCDQSKIIAAVIDSLRKEIASGGDLSDALRGAQGKPGSPGDDGQSGHVSVTIVTETGEELYRLSNLKPGTQVDLPLRMRQTK